MEPCRHLFLTGEIQVGKSTILNRLAAQCFRAPGGFCTRWDTAEHRTLHLLSYPPCLPCGTDNLIARRQSLDQMQVWPERFDLLGPQLLARPGDGIVMDELGFLERDAMAFQAAVLAALDGARPVLGVIKPRAHPFLDQIRRHPRVRVELVTPENRDALLQTLLCEAREGRLWRP